MHKLDVIYRMLTIVLENRLDQLQEKNRDNNDFSQLLRMLREENGLIIEKYWDIVKNNLKLQKKNISNPDEILPRIEASCPHTQHYRNQTFAAFSASFMENSMLHLKNYLTIMCFLECEKEIKESIFLKTKFLFNLLEKFFESNCIGSFLLIKVNPSTNKFAYNASSSTLFYETQNDVITKFLEGEHRFLGSDSKDVSIVEFSRCKENEDEWENLYHHGNDEERVRILIPYEYNRLCLLRINKKEIPTTIGEDVINDIPQGVIGFYFNAESNSLTKVTQTRYLLLLRPFLSQFMKEHHENNEFRDLLDALTSKRYAMLMGHGREMLLHLSSEDDRFKRIILDLENLQLIATFKDTVHKISPQEITKIEYFKLFYDIGDVLTNETFQNLKELAKQIFKHSWIEDTVDISPSDEAFVVHENFSFQFSQRILNLICFELFINAKKNRWNFIDNEEIESDDKNRSPVCFSNNIFNFTVTIDGEKLQIVVSNTCPIYDIENSIYILNQGENPKNRRNNNPDLIAGLSLIQTLLSDGQNGFDLGKIKYKYEIVNQEKGFGYFQVFMSLKPLKND